MEYKFTIFLCHATDDKPAVRSLYKRLLIANLRPWLDEENLLPGQDWREEVDKAIRNSLVVLVCLSSKSVSKTGYIQKEIKHALDVADEYPFGEIFIIPVRLEACIIPRQLQNYQLVDLFEEKGFDNLLRILRFKLFQKYGGTITLFQYAEELYLSAGYGDLPLEIRNGLIEDIVERTYNFLLAKSINALSSEDSVALQKLADENASNERVQEFFSEKIPNITDFTSTALLEFRAIYLGLAR